MDNEEATSTMTEAAPVPVSEEAPPGFLAAPAAAEEEAPEPKEKAGGTPEPKEEPFLQPRPDPAHVTEALAAAELEPTAEIPPEPSSPAEAQGASRAESVPRRVLIFGRNTLSLLAWAAVAGLATKAAGGWKPEEMAYFALLIGCVVLLAAITDGYPRRTFGALGVAFSLLYTLFLLDMADQQGATSAVAGETRDLLLLAIAGSLVLLLLSGLRLLPPRRP